MRTTAAYIASLLSELAALKVRNTELEAQLTRLREALEFYSNRSVWHECLAQGRVGRARDGEHFMAFDDGEDHPWSVAEQALSSTTPAHPQPEAKK